MTWFGICLVYIRFHAGMKAQGLNRRDLPYASPLQPYAAWYGLFMCFIVCFVRPSPLSHHPTCMLTYARRLQFSGWAVFLKDSWDTATFVTNYLPLILFPILYIGAKLWKRTPMHRPEDMDFVTGLKEIEADSYVAPSSPSHENIACLLYTRTTGTTSPHQGIG